MLDRYLWGTVGRISPEAPVPIVNITGTSVVLGGAANVAANVVGLGGKAILAGVCGDDADAATLRDLLGTAKIDFELLSATGRPTTVKTRLVAHSQQVARFDNEVSSPISPATSETFLRSIRNSFASASVVIISDYAKGLLTGEVIAEIVATGKKRGVRVIVDPKGRDYSKYSGANILTPNRREAADAASLDENDPDLIAKAGADLVSRLNLEALLITEGEHGMTLFDGAASSIHFDTAARDVYDVTGAGDTVIASFAAALGANATLPQAAQIANVAAGLSVEEVGTTVVSRDAIRKRLGSDPANITQFV